MPWPRNRSCKPEILAAPFCCRRTRPRQGWEPSCPKFRKVRNTLSCLSAGSWRRLRGTTLMLREALAVKWAVLELRYYLLGQKFTLLTDHAPLQWMARAKDNNARVMRWFLVLQDFCFVFRHRAGASNANADGLSRFWSAFAGLSGVTPHPPPISPLSLPYVSTRTRTTFGGSVTSVPITH